MHACRLCYKPGRSRQLAPSPCCGVSGPGCCIKPSVSAELVQVGAEGKRLRPTMLLLMASALSKAAPPPSVLNVDERPPSHHPAEERRCLPLPQQQPALCKRVLGLDQLPEALQTSSWCAAQTPSRAAWQAACSAHGVGACSCLTCSSDLAGCRAFLEPGCVTTS